jgi:hypothetical protein
MLDELHLRSGQLEHVAVFQDNWLGPNRRAVEGRFPAPSTCATTNPWGRFVIAATATPGFPMVVTTFTKATSRPAAAPDMTLIAA